MKKKIEHIDFKPFAEEIRKIREFREITQEKAALDLGMTIRYYQKLEKGIGRPSWDAFARMVRYFNMSVDELFLTYKRPKKSCYEYKRIALFIN